MKKLVAAFAASIASLLTTAALAAPMTITAPTAAALPKAAPISIQWTAGSPGWEWFDVTLWQITPSAVALTGMAAGNNAGHVTVTLPSSVVCDPSHSYKFRVKLTFNMQAAPTAFETADSAPFRLTCGIHPSGSNTLGRPVAIGGMSAVGRLTPVDRLTVNKRIINNTKYPTPKTSFQVKVDCEPSGPHTVVTLTPPANPQQIVSVPVSDNCTISEIPPPAPPKPCKWVTTYPDGQVADKPGSARLVINELKCEG
jgi:hypothetical protein